VEKLQKKTAPAGQTKRKFVQGAEAISFFSDYTQLVVTEDGVLLQHYETIPGTPDDTTHIQDVTSRLRATVMMSQGSLTRLIKVGQELLDKKETTKP
jgi:hypothetical protein